MIHTGLIWLQNANCFSEQTWGNALASANALASGNCGLSDDSVAGDWRLPNVKELQSLFDFSNFDPALPDNHPFSGVQSALYWSSTTYAANLGHAWIVASYDGPTGDVIKDLLAGLVWPVRGGE